MKTELKSGLRLASQQRSKGIKDATMRLYVRLLAHQNNKCAICKGEPNDKLLILDHNHVTKAVRGLLCYKCNSALGGLERLLSIEGGLEIAQVYLKNSWKEQSLPRVDYIEEFLDSPRPVIASRRVKVIQRIEEVRAQDSEMKTPRILEKVAKEFGLTTHTLRNYLGNNLYGFGRYGVNS